MNFENKNSPSQKQRETAEDAQIRMMREMGKHKEAETFSAPSRIEVLNHVLQTRPDDFDGLDASMLFLDESYEGFRDKIKKLGKQGKAFELVFVVDDLGKTIDERKMRLRQLKALLEDERTNKVISKITVKGSADTKDIEPNVFASGVYFEKLG